MHFQNRSRIHSLIFPAHTPDKQQPPQPGPCAVSLRLLCTSLALHLLTLHSSLADASREQSQQVLPCSYHSMTPLLTEIKSIPSNILEAHRIWDGPQDRTWDLTAIPFPSAPAALGSPLNTDTLLPSCICPGGSSAWREPPLDLLVDIPSCSSQLCLKVTFSVRPLSTLVTQPPSLSLHTHTLGHLPQSTHQPQRETLPHLLGS